MMTGPSPGEAAGSWLVDDILSLGEPRTFKAHHVGVGTEALLKVVPASKATTDGQDREVAALRELSHESLPEVLDFGVEHDREMVWTAFRWFEADPLQDRLLSGSVDWRDACAMFRDLASALAHVHAAGLVHRDIRPAHVLVDRSWSAWLTGFDYAMTQAELEKLSEAPFGDLAYLAPEVLRDPTHHGAKADVYAFGCLMFEVLTGRAAFPAAAWGERPDQAARMLEWKGRAEPLDPGDACPDWLRNMVTKCTQPDPDRRLPDIEALVGWLDAAQATWMRRKAARPASERPEPVAAPPPILVPAAPSLRAAPPPVVTATPAPVPRPANQGIPVVVQYFAAGTLGCLTALGFSALIILFVELQRGMI